MAVANSLDRFLNSLPGLSSWYRRNTARLKRNYCLWLDRAGLLRPITFVQWLATYECNYFCPFCEASAGRGASDELTREEVFALIDDLVAMRVQRFLISGGEPFERPDLLTILRYASQKGLQLGLVSNGFHVREKWEELRELRFFLYFTSLDGAPDFHGQNRGNKEAFGRALEAIELFGKLRVPTRIINTVVYPGNLDQLEKMLPLVESSHATHWHLTPLANIGRACGEEKFQISGQDLKVLLQFIRSHQVKSPVAIVLGESHSYLQCVSGIPLGKPHFCGAGLTRCSIMPNGDVLGCQQVYDSSFAEGNIRQKSFSKIWREEFRRFRGKQVPPACQGCALWTECQGGCWAEMAKQGHCLKNRWDECEKPIKPPLS